MLKRLANKLKPKANREKKDAEMRFMLDGMIAAVSGSHPSKPEDEAAEIIAFMQDCKTIEKDLALKELESFQSKVQTYIDEEQNIKKQSPRLRFLRWVDTAYNHFSGKNNIFFDKVFFEKDSEFMPRLLHYTNGKDQTRLLSALLYSKKYSFLAKPKLQEMAFAEFLKLLNQLIHKNPAEVIDIIKQRPALKNIRASVVDQFGIPYDNVTFYEAALYLGDAPVLQQIESCYTPLELNEFNRKKFLPYVLQGNENAVKAMLNEDPSLLNYSGTAHDRTGRIYKDVTGYQAAYLCADFQMMRMMEGYFASEEDKLSQHHAIFPECNIKNVLKNRPKFNFTDIVDAIDKAEPDAVKHQLNHKLNDSMLCQKMNTFREDFKKLSLSEVLINLKHLKKAYKIYDEKFNNWKWDKRDLFFRQVIGFVQAISLPENIKQIYHQGLWDYVVALGRGEVPINNRFGGFQYSECALHLSSGTGFNYGGGMRAAAGGRGAGGPSSRDAFDWKSYVEHTHRTYRTYADSLQPSTAVCESLRS